MDPFKTKVMGKNGVTRALNNYTIEIIAGQYKTIWENIVNIPFNASSE
jgi:hypothetical protein